MLNFLQTPGFKYRIICIRNGQTRRKFWRFLSACVTCSALQRRRQLLGEDNPGQFQRVRRSSDNNNAFVGHIWIVVMYVVCILWPSRVFRFYRSKKTCISSASFGKGRFISRADPFIKAETKASRVLKGNFTTSAFNIKFTRMQQL